MKENAQSLRLGNPRRFWAVMALLWGLLGLTLVLNVNIGSISIGVDQVFSMLLDGLRGNVDSSTESQILFRIRIPRMLLAAILGGALSVRGGARSDPWAAPEPGRAASLR